MVILTLTPPVLSSGYIHNATDYQIATDPLFITSSIVKEVLGDSINKITKTFDIDLDPNITYYARARFIFNTFTAEWSNVEIVILEDTKYLDTHMDIPSIVSVPNIYIDYDLDKVPTTFFTITTDDIITTSNAIHDFTTYIIVDTNGDVYLSNIEDKDNLTKLFIYKDKLPENKTYILYVQHGSTSGDVSNFSKLVFKTTPYGAVDIISNTDKVIGTDLLLKFATVSDMSLIYTDLYAVSKTDKQLLHSQTNDVFIFTILNTYFKSNVAEYILSVKIKYIDGTYSQIRYIPIKVY